MRFIAFILVLLLLGACQPSLEGPSLAVRPAESIDPRLPVGSPEPPPGPLTIADRLDAIERALTTGRAEFDRQLGPTQTRVANAGARGSENWVVALEALSLLERAHEDVAVAVADLDRLVTDQIEADGWASPTDRAAAKEQLVMARGVSEEQRSQLASLSARLSG
ncbi:hypothetical protein WJT74_01615 [Sphingomicrobium sp. XHP0239]|uniref:hypothetical protein n=1 Tax=Sphingomicrobium maritimum TaxID=3133972 RepID=UPI0031CC63FC